MVILYELCDSIVQFRNKLGITQAELGRKLGVTRSAVNTWEMGLSIPQLKHVVQMSEIFNTTIDTLISSSKRVTIDITDLDPKEQEVILNMISCLKSKRTDNQS